MLKQARAYQNTGNYSSTMYADPHSLVTQMFDGALQRLAQAKGAMARGDIKQKAETISKAIRIIGGLEGCLDHEQGGDLSQNLASLYEYMNLTLAQANIQNDITKLEEVSTLLTEIKSAWLQIPAQLNRASA
ncbi:MAG: flagellar export chaperone FliS [Gammaproteobacteria bacterium]|nr:flagellar export chaperone FliS [Gammaproteobacteria bacterium]